MLLIIQKLCFPLNLKSTRKRASFTQAVLDSRLHRLPHLKQELLYILVLVLKHVVGEAYISLFTTLGNIRKALKLVLILANENSVAVFSDLSAAYTVISLRRKELSVFISEKINLG